MSKKRAFVRYTKSGEIVPGSLIITTNGGYPDKSSLWKEVTVDQCCDGGGEAPLSNTTVCASVDSEMLDGSVYRFTLASTDSFIIQFYTTSNVPLTTYEMLVEYFNTNFSFLGQFTYTAPNQICLQISTGAVTGTQVQNYPDPSEWLFEIIVP